MVVRHLLLSGLRAHHVDSGGLTTLERHPPRQRARLVCSFGASPAAVEATLLTGVPPRDHGVLFADDHPRQPPRIADLHRRVDPPEGVRTPAELLRALDAVLGEHLDGARGDELLLVSTGAPSIAAGRVIDLPPAVGRGDDLRLRPDPGFALLEPTRPGARLEPRMRDALLATPGIARVLDPDPGSAGSWMAPTDRGWILLPEPGYVFGDAGPRTPGGPGAVLLAFGPEWSRPWPDAVHDWRVAPTLLAALGRGLDGCFDEPLAGSAALRG